MNTNELLDKLNTIICGDNVTVLSDFPAACIDLTVTSPPYDNLRLYNGFTWDFVALARQLYRVTKPGGVVVWVVGDATIDGSETGTSFRQALYFKDCGFNLHDTMIYGKAGFRFPDANRYNPVFEYMFILSKGFPKIFNPIEDKKNEYAGGLVARRSQNRNTDGSLTENSAWRNDKNKIVKTYGKRDNIWRYSIGGEQEIGDHPAIFPESLARDHILSWSDPGDLVLDPFIGSGTTAKMAKETGRQFIGIDISAEYCKLAERRIKGANVPLFV
jgi:DNA modification methylase